MSKAHIQIGKDSASKLEENGFVKVRCRLCGEPWLFPPKMAEQFDADHGFECIYCRKVIRSFGVSFAQKED